MKTETTIDKSAWGDGPWQAEADKYEWTDEATGLDCLIVRANAESGHLCGYVGVPEGHPFHGKHYDYVDVSVHGGLTYAEACSGRVCHDKPGDHIWWLGFDCAHRDDILPGCYRRFSSFPYGTYKDVDYVRAECASLARQIHEARRGQ